MREENHLGVFLDAIHLHPLWASGYFLKHLHYVPFIRSLGSEDPLQEEMATHPSILAWRIPCTEEPGGLPCIGLQRVRHDRETNIFTTLLCKISIAFEY